MNKYTLPFNLAEAQRGAEFGTASGSRCELIGYSPQRRKGFRVIVRDIKSDHLCSHAEDGTHNHSTQRDLFMAAPIQEPAATKSVAQETNLLSRELRTEIIKLVRATICAEESNPAPAAKVVRWLAVWETNTAGGAHYCSPVLWKNEFEAVTRAKIAVQGTGGAYINPRAVRVEL